MSPLLKLSDALLRLSRRSAFVFLSALAVTLCLAMPARGADLVIDDNNANSPHSITSGSFTYDVVYAGAVSDGVINHSGGTVNAGTVYAAWAGGSTGTYNLSNTASLSAGNEFVGYGGFASFNQSGGTNTVTNTLSIGNFTSTYTLSGGALSAAHEDIGDGGAGTLTQTGGTNTVTGTVTLGLGSSAQGLYNLDGGVLQTTQVNRGSGTASFKFNGGTLRAAADSVTFMTGLSGALVSTGGANIDTNGHNITIGQALLHDPNLGASLDGGLTKLGSGTLTLGNNNTFTGPLTFSAGTVSANVVPNLGASTNALNFDGGTLRVTGTFINDFASHTVNATTFNGGLDIAHAANTFSVPGGLSGSNLTKAGAGTLTLGGTNSFTGTVNVSGLLNFSGGATYSSAATNVGTGASFDATNLPSSTLGILNGQSLSGAGTVSPAVAVGAGGNLAPGNSVGTITVGMLTLGSGSISTYEFNGTANDFTNVTVSNGLTINGGSFTLYDEGTTDAFDTVGSYDLMGYVGTLQGSVNSLSVSNPAPGRNYTFSNDAGRSRIVLTVATVDVSVAVLPSATVEDGAGNLVFTFTRNGDTSGTLTVNFSVGGAALFNSDYTENGADSFGTTSGTVTFAAGNSTAVVTIDPTPDAVFEANELVTLTITPDAAYNPVAPTSASAAIANDDTAPSISINSVTVNEGAGTADFTVTQSAVTGTTTTFEYTTADVSATAGSDYTGATNAPASITAGNTATTVSIPIANDTVFEGTETFTVTLSNANNATIGTASGTGTITENDPAPSFTIDDVTHLEGDSGTTAYLFTVTKSATNTALNATVDYATVNGTATEPTDYTAIPTTTLTFLPGDTTKQFTVSVIGDTATEPDEAFTVHLSNATNATIADADGTGTIQNDDCTPPPAGMISWWSGENNPNDIYGPNNGSWVGTPAYGTGKVGQAFDFNGTNSYVTAPGNGSLNLTGSQMTMDGWIYPRANTPGTFYFAKSALSNHPYVVYFSAGTVHLIISTTGGDNQEFDTLYIPPVNAWTHLAMVYSNPSLKFYVNGALFYSVNVPQTGNLRSSTIPFAIGNRATNPGAFFNGLIDEVEVFNTAISATEVANLYNAGSFGKCHLSTFQFSAPTYTVAENGVNATITVTRIGTHDTAATVDYATVAGGNATAGASCGGGTDYITTSGTLSFAATETSKTFDVPVCNDGVFENPETVNLQLSNVTGAGASTGTPSTAVLTITDEDCYEPPANMIAWYPGENNTNDIQGPTFETGTNTGGVTFTTGKVGQAFNFNGSNSVSLGSPAALKLSGSVTVDAWVRPTVTAANGTLQGVVSKWAQSGAISPNSDSFSLWLQYNTSLGAWQVFSLVHLANGSEPGALGGTVPLNVFSHVAMTYNATTGAFAIYVNGVNVGNSSSTPQGIIGVDAQIAIGREPTGSARFFTGQIDEAEIYSRALTPQEIADLYNAGAFGKCKHGLIQFSAPTYSVGEAGPTASITVRRTDGSVGAVSAQFDTSNGTATAGSDYTAMNTFIVAWADGDTADQTVPIPIGPDDTVYEGNETVNLALTNATGGAQIGPQATAILTITENDPAPSFAIDDVTHLEGASGMTAYVFTVTKTNATALSSSVNYTTADSTATTADGDYAATSGTLTFAPGDMTMQITVQANGDTKFEPNEQFFVNLSSPVNATISDASGTGTITNDDDPPSFAIDDVEHNEGQSGTTAYVFTVTKTGATSLNSTVDFTTQDGTATTANNDYASNNGILTFLPGETTKQITVQVTGDTAVEPNEAFTVHLSNPTAASISDADGTGTITNDDTEVSVTVSPASTAEDTGPNLVYTFTRTGVTTGSLTANFSVGGTASSTSDYTQSGATTFTPPTGTVSFGAGETTVDVTIDPTIDLSDEPDETVVLTVTSGTGYTVGSPSAATGTITDDDPISLSLVVTKTADTNDGFCSLDDCSLREALSSANLLPDANTISFNIPTSDPNRNGTTGVFTITPASALPTITQPVTIDGYSQSGASANTLAVGSDAVLLIEINGTNTSGYGLFVDSSNNTIKGLVINRSPQSEIRVNGGNTVVQGNFLGTDASGTTDLGNTVRSGIELNGQDLANGNNNTVGGANPADRNVISGSNGSGIIIINGASGNTVQNNYIGTDKSGTIGLGNAVSGLVIDHRTNNTVRGNLISGNGDGVEIRSDNALFTTPNKVLGNFIGTKANGTEALGNTGAGVILHSDATNNIIGGTLPGEGNTIAFNGSDGVSLTSGTDTPVRGNSIFSNGTTNLHLGIDLDPDGVTANDAGDGDTGVNNLQNFPVIQTALAGSPNRIRGTLNSTPGQTFTIDVYSNSACDSSGNGEGQTYLGSTTTTTGANGDGLWSFNPATMTAGDFITATATDSTGNTSEFSACFEAITFTPGTIGFAQANTDSTETNSGTHTVDITVTRSGGSDGAVSVTYTVTDGTATTGDSDYSASPASGTFNWANGDSSNRTITITVNGDTKFEADETVNITLSSATGGAAIGTNPATVTIKNDDAQPAISIDNVTHSEGNSGNTSYDFTVSLSNPSSQTITVDYATADDSATAPSDYVAVLTTSLTFNPGETTKPVTVQVNGDTTIETDEQFFVNLSNASNATIADSQGVGSIINDDTDVSVTVSPASVAEDGGTDLVYTFTRNPLTSGPITVNFSVGGTAEFGTDYTQTGAATFGTTSGTVVIQGGNTTATVTIHPSGDMTVEQDETAVLTVTSGTGYNVGSPDAATGTITNDDTDVSVAVSPASVVENDAINLEYTFTRTGVTSGAITVNFSVGGTATFSTDYTQSGATSFSSSSGTIILGDGVTSATMTVDPTGDTIYESNETVILTVTSGAGYNPGVPAAATGTITNDDTAPTLSIGDKIAFEGNTGGTTPFAFTVTKTGSTELPVTVQFATADGATNPATGGAVCGPGIDYVSQSGTLTFPPSGAGSTSQAVTIDVCRDTTVEPNETFFVQLSGETNASLSDGEGRGTIQNDDAPPPLVPVNTTSDAPDDGVCNATHCSLREAIATANLSPGAVSITFAIPATDPGLRHFYYKDDGVPNQVTNDGTHVLVTTAVDDASLPADKDPDWAHGWWSIQPASPLPAITQTVTINAYSQAGASANTLTATNDAVLRIELSGASAGASVTGLTVNGSASDVRGLVINRFTGNGLNLQGGNSSAAGNFIGTDVSGTLDLGNAGHGIASSGFSESIGGSTPADVNVISGNDGDGIAFTNSNSDLVLGNMIGTKTDKTSALGNGGHGVSFFGGASVFNTLGGDQPADGNTIAHNGGDGVQVDATAGIGNSIRGNSTFSNGTTAQHLGIDLGPDGVTPNDPAIDKDADTGPNNLQNFPTITLARATGSTKTINGTLNSSAGDTFTIDFYANTTCDGSGNGEGQSYLGSTTTGATDSNGDVSFTFHPDAGHAAAMTPGKFITATATSTGGAFNTSEFSACLQVIDGSAGAGEIQFTSSTYNGTEGSGPVTISFTRVGGTNGSVTANFSTSNGTAQAPGDYTAVSNVPITYVEGETGTKTVTLTIADDLVYEHNETVNLNLSNTQITSPNLGESADPIPDAATASTATLTIADNDQPPSFAVNDVIQDEGNNGTTAYLFTVTKTGGTEITATVKYETVNGTATAPSDFTAIPATTLTFLAGDTTKQFTVLVNGDTTFELGEAFTVHLSAAGDATISDADGTGTIRNDDPLIPPSPTPTPTPTPIPSPTPTPSPTPPVPTPTPTPTPATAQSLNISTRLRVETGDKAMIAGFIIQGDAAKPVLLRGMGPSLAALGISNVLLDPVLELRGPNGSIMTNDNWVDSPQRSQFEGTVFQPNDVRESVVLATLSAANYTAILTGSGQTTGVGLVEVYDRDQSAAAQLANISTRGFVQAGENVMIGGFILGGNPDNARIALRGVGPSLSQFGLNPVLADPTLELRTADGTILVANDNWTDDAASAALLTANGLALSDPKESGIFTSLPPGQFTAILAGKNGGIGIGLIEVYNLR